jgi:hypothetical protein
LVPPRRSGWNGFGDQIFNNEIIAGIPAAFQYFRRTISKKGLRDLRDH